MRGRCARRRFSSILIARTARSSTQIARPCSRMHDKRPPHEPVQRTPARPRRPVHDRHRCRQDRAHRRASRADCVDEPGPYRRRRPSRDSAARRAAYPPRCRADGRRARVEHERHAVRGHRALGRAQGDNHARGHQNARACGDRHAARPRDPARTHARRRDRSDARRAEGDAGSEGRGARADRSANRRVPAGGHRIVRRRPRADGAGDRTRRGRRWRDSAFREHAGAGRQLDPLPDGPRGAHGLPRRRALRRDRRSAFALSRSACGRGTRARHGGHA